MKEIVLVAISALTFTILTKAQVVPALQDWPDFPTKVEQECINKTGIDETIIERTKVTLELPEDPQYKTYISCVYKKQGYQNEDGDILLYNIKNMITDKANGTLAADLINSCKDFALQPTHEEGAYAVAKCLYDTIKNYNRGML